MKYIVFYHLSKTKMLWLLGNMGAMEHCKKKHNTIAYKTQPILLLSVIFIGYSHFLVNDAPSFISCLTKSSVSWWANKRAQMREYISTRMYWRVMFSRNIQRVPIFFFFVYSWLLLYINDESFHINRPEK